jgi:hypothetical protein
MLRMFVESLAQYSMAARGVLFSSETMSGKLDTSFVVKLDDVLC